MWLSVKLVSTDLVCNSMLQFDLMYHDSYSIRCIGGSCDGFMMEDEGNTGILQHVFHTLSDTSISMTQLMHRMVHIAVEELTLRQLCNSSCHVQVCITLIVAVLLKMLDSYA